MDPVAADFQLSLIVWLSMLALAGLCSWAYFASRASSDGGASSPGNGTNGTSKTSRPATPLTDKDLESSRISYGFWLIIAGFLITLAVVIVSMNHFRPGAPGSTATTADVVAVVTAVTGVIGTLTAAFFGIQAAGAGRSQALSALSEQMKNGSKSASIDYKIDPLAGPHKGNTRVTISGNGFSGANAVNFGPTPGVNPQFVNDGLIYATTPGMPFDPNAATENVRSDVDVTIVFPGSSQNKVIGKFYYYTVDVARDKNNINVTYVNIFGSGLTGASHVQFGTYPPVAVEKATEFELQIPVRKYTDSQKAGDVPKAADGPGAGAQKTAEEQKAADAQAAARTKADQAQTAADEAQKRADEAKSAGAANAELQQAAAEAKKAAAAAKAAYDLTREIDPVFKTVWDNIWNQEVDVTIIFGSDPTASKRMPIGRYRIPEYDPPAETTKITGPADMPGGAAGGTVS